MTFQPNQRYYVVGRRTDQKVYYAVMDVLDYSLVTEWMQNSYDLVRAKAWSLESELGFLEKKEFDPLAKWVKSTRFDEEETEYAVFTLDRLEMRAQLKVVRGDDE